MKVRWTTGSLRFRISPTEFGRLQNGETVTVALSLPGGGWQATLTPAAETRLCGTDTGGVTLHLSPDAIACLADPTKEGVYFSGGGLRYYVEKDFPCVHPGAAEAAEAPTETFVPPPGFKERHTESCGGPTKG